MQRVAAEQLECTEEQLEQQFAELVALLPGIRERMHTIKADRFASLVENPARIAERLIQLKAVFPKANVEQMVLRSFDLLLTRSVEEISQAAEELRDLLPSAVNVDRSVPEPSALYVSRSPLNQINKQSTILCSNAAPMSGKHMLLYAFRPQRIFFYRH